MNQGRSPKKIKHNEDLQEILVYVGVIGTLLLVSFNFFMKHFN
jgi:hypothetical protein